MRKSKKLYVGAVLLIAVLMSIQAGAASLMNSFEGLSKSLIEKKKKGIKKC